MASQVPRHKLYPEEVPLFLHWQAGCREVGNESSERGES